jgi:hypothetical protein
MTVWKSCVLCISFIASSDVVGKTEISAPFGNINLAFKLVASHFTGHVSVIFIYLFIYLTTLLLGLPQNIIASRYL